MSEQEYLLRLERAQELVEGVTEEEEAWSVPSQSGGDPYQVTQSDGIWTCECIDFLKHEEDPAFCCKHILAVQLHQEQQMDHHMTEELTKAQADVYLWEIGVLEEQMEEIGNMARTEIGVIEEWRTAEQAKCTRRITQLAGLLEGFIHSQDKKTLSLPHGKLQLRTQPDRVEVDEATFTLDQDHLIRIVPEKRMPDLRKIKAWIKETGEIPEGVTLVPGGQKFSYATVHRAPTTTQEEVEVLPKAA